MNEADEMFKELGYIKDREFDYIRYRKILSNYEHNDIIFDLEHNLLNIVTEDILNYQSITTVLNIQELRAINEKIKELGWNE